MKLGFYGGTFDPIHHGHLILARDAVEKLGLDRLYFIPNGRSPHKLENEPTSPDIRVELLRAAIEGHPRFDLETCEAEREGPSYTVETMRMMRERFGPDATYYYLIGRDNLPTLHTWEQIGELQQLVQFVVMSRDDDTIDAPEGMLTLQRRLDISATEIRTRVARRQSIRYLVPDSVNSLIKHHRLYLT